MLQDRQVVCLSSLPWHGRPTSRHHLAQALSATNDVLFVDPHVNLLRSRRAHRGRTTVEPEGIVRLEPPPHLPFGGRVRFRLSTPVNQRRYAAAVARCLDDLGWRSPILWTSFPVYASARVAERIHPAAHVLHMTDSLWELPQYRPEYEGFLRRILRSVDVAVAPTEAIARRLRDYGVACRILEHGVDVDHYAPVARGAVRAAGPLSELPPPRLGFVGQLDHRLDLDAVAALAEVGSVVLVGPSILGAAATRRLQEAGCWLVGPVPYADLPAWMAGFEVALLPYRPLPVVAASRPLKLLEYLAAGLPVVASDVGAARELAPHVSVAADRDVFLAAVAAAIEGAGDREERLRRLEVASRHSWHRRAEELSEIIRKADATHG